MWGLYVDYSRSAMGYISAMWQKYLFRAHASNVKCIDRSAPGYITDCSQLVRGTYIDTVVS